ncbi:NAD(P)(+) transhydrogenase (Re/Si-specific) subunit beta [Solirubrobacter sp. CPCC 204708]|uniref:NAD(P) transhydrogenase subunit beta n=1 Tax=Solirubrobacter deserti TaxID=2282478 RepID=A0ABT4RE94_9ACTN|nr:NAD(P)(+) transhydrogenase (Re/Si-specific) subunit beta [Solirubrobacter deserti]MBE2314638.1 NAD(P)(+) transhydrogenase (Re/Si-specific) subunit beta [Solirubrobacter deserti]MDA0136645.1 NAD(P)(+) transhydrogenase (Re/Si-specific) subunit beta [Solirubrobacter deserti]
MSRADVISALYIVAFTLFIVGLRMLRAPRTAVRGNQVAAVGMAIAVGATLAQDGVGDWALIIGGIAIGVAVGVPAAQRVKMTAMPQMVALFNGVGGGAVAIIAIVEFRAAEVDLPLDELIPLLFAAIIGSISFWGSNIAFLKLQELMKGSIRTPPAVNAALLAIAVALAAVIAAGSDSELLFWLILLSAGALGVLAVVPIGGADMPVVISTLNAFTGLSAAAAGIALDNTALIVAGMLVGASGSILTKQMADAMNRSIGNVFFAGVGTGAASALAAPGGGGTARSTSAADVAIQLSYARLVVVVPGYGMAVAQAQRAVADLAVALEKRGVEVLYAIHPVAGRMPGHMNVLLAEADVPYDKLKEMDDINGEFARTDVSLVIGANDVTNPAARTEPGSPIYGMPILDVDKSSSVIVLKRSMSSGFAGIDNPLFYDPKTAMLFGDAKASVADILTEVQAL